MLTPEDYSVSSSDGFDTKSYDEGGWDGTGSSFHGQDYITINLQVLIEMHGVEVLDGSNEK